MSDIFTRAKGIAVTKIREWLPGGDTSGQEYTVRNPTRNDEHAGSLMINLVTGKFIDNADDDFVGHDAITLYAKLHGLRNYEAAREILGKYDPLYFPGADDFKASETWYQLTKGKRDAPELALQSGETTRWPLEIKVAKDWRTVMMIVRFIDSDGSKKDLPFTLWTDGKSVEWRRKALTGVKYPLFGLRALTENPNAKVVLYEGQKKAATLQPVLGEEYACVGWYGGAGNPELSDLEPLIGREIWYPFDADNPGRKAIKILMDELHVKLHLVYPPPDVPKGWDHADAVRDGMTREWIIELLNAENNASDTANIPIRLGLAPEHRPSRLDVPVTNELRETVLDAVYQEKIDAKGTKHITIRADWFFWLVQNDSVIRNCIKYDYTTGTKATAYDSSDIFDAAMERRLQEIGIAANLVTKTVKERMFGEILLHNSNFNRVTDYMDTLSAQYSTTGAEVLDEFMQVFKFNIEKEYGESESVYYNRVKECEKLYKELFNIFFIRMHAHIRGTRKTKAGEYYGLIENDIVPILEGPQGIGKTTLCKWLSCDEELYIDLGSGLRQGFGSAETYKKVRGRLIAEIGEMKIMKSGQDVETIKSFVSAKVATVDIKYVESQRDIPLTASYFGTSNTIECLFDDTGNRRWWIVRLADIDKKLIAEKRDLPMRLHAYYTRLTMPMSMEEIFKAQTASAELDSFMGKLRDQAMITYSDYEVCLKVIRAWKNDNPMGGELQQSDIEKSAYGSGYTTRISQKSFRKAIKDAGFKQERRYDDNVGRAPLAWTWSPAGKQQELDPIPF